MEILKNFRVIKKDTLMAVITIARQFGAGGRSLGDLVAKELGYTLIDREIVEMIAMEADVSPDRVDAISKEAGSEGYLTRMFVKMGPRRKGYINVTMEEKPGYIDAKLYISLLYKIIPKIASQDNMVIIGRGGQYILADHPNTYHYLMIANMERRICFMINNYQLDHKQARFIVDKQEKRRLNLYRYFGRTDYDQPGLYDMVFNMNRVKLAVAARVVCQMVSGSASS
jgi:cytidylate kinase